MPCHAVPDEQALDRLVLRLTALKAPKLFIWFVVLVYFQEEMWPQAPMPFEAVEFFCGDSAVTKSCRRAYIVTAGLDLTSRMRRTEGLTGNKIPSTYLLQLVLRLLEDGIHHFQHEIDECLFASVQDQSIFKWKLIDPGLCARLLK